MKKNIVAIALVGAAVVGLAGCTSTEGTVGEGKPITNATSVASEKTEEPAANEEAEEPKSDGGIAKIGKDSKIYDDGLEVAVLSSRSAALSDYYRSEYGATAYAVKVRITNNTDEVFDADLADVAATYGSDGTQAKPVFDSGAGFDGGFDGSVAPGRSITAEYGFVIPAGERASALLEVTPSWGHDAAFFEK